MGKYLLPLKVFVGGQVVMLVVYLFFPALGDAGTQLAADTAAASASVGGFWGWTWVVGSVKLIVFLTLEMVIFYATARAILAVRE